MKVELIDHMGSDLTVVNAARVSFDKQSWWLPIEEGYEACSGGEIAKVVGVKLRACDAKLINYLAKHKHWTPFGHCTAQFRVTAPIFVARQLAKHQVGLVWNEVSRRYVDSEPEFFVPEAWRLKAEDKKQGSSEEVLGAIPGILYEHSGFELLPIDYDVLMDVCRTFYNRLLEDNVCPEQARMVLPQAMYTQWYWTGSLMAFARVCKLRLDPHAQKETQVIAKGIAGHMEKLFPVSWQALMDKEVV